MKQISIKCEPRKVGNKQTIKTFRREGRVPGNLYGNGVENILFTVDAKDLKLITDTPQSYIVSLEIGAKKYLAVLHEVQYHPITDEALHVDFLAVDEKKPVAISVPVVVTGHAEGVKQGGRLFVAARKLKISALLDKLPDTIEVDSTPLLIGKQIVAGDLKYDGVTILSPKVTIICSVRPTRAAAASAASAEGAQASAE